MKDEALDNDCTSDAPINVYRTEPRPPEILVPPSTTAVMLISVKSMPVAGEPMPTWPAKISPPIP